MFAATHTDAAQYYMCPLCSLDCSQCMCLVWSVVVKNFNVVTIQSAAAVL